jgi:hypothetical protein
VISLYVLCYVFISLTVLGCVFWLFNIVFIIAVTLFVGILMYIFDVSEHIIVFFLSVSLVSP